MDKEQYINSVNLNAGSDFPYLVLNVIGGNSYPRNSGFQVMHWHEDLQLIYVLEGMIEVQTLETSIRVKAGEGIYINKEVIHHVKQIEGCHYNSFLFPSCFLSFYPTSPARSLVESITGNSELQLILFDRREEWHVDVLELLCQLVPLEDNKTELYPYEVLVRICSLWLIMCRNIELPDHKNRSILHTRMQKMLRFIEEHYGDDIELEDLARSADISKSECARCFRQSMDTTPYKYLTEYRLSKAAAMLKQSDEPIGNIASAVGFGQMSHFGKCFKEKTGLSPGGYRRRK